MGFTYVVLMKITQQGFKTIKESPTRVKQATDRMVKMGGKMLSVHYTQGEYDLVCVVEWPTEEAATAFALATASQGNVTLQTMRAFSVEEIAAVVSKIP
jgi:uncharacterized protein with GYD domain